ncbi:hypothetical protein ACLB2K_068304 [Fragaria x ananassa]
MVEEIEDPVVALHVEKAGNESILSLSLSSDFDSDADLASVPRRTIDEILNDSDSSTSPSPSSSSRNSTALSQFLASDPKPPQSDAVSVAAARSSQLEEKSVQLGLNLYSRARSGDFPDDQVRRVSRPSLWLLGGVRTNVKPGAALVATAAASKSMPTPHAAAIKSRRSAKSGSFQKVVEAVVAAELGVRSEDSNAVGFETTTMSSNGVEEGFGGELGRKEMVNICGLVNFLVRGLRFV